MHFVIPEQYRAWCNLCDKGFKSIDELQKHDRDNLYKHQLTMEKRRKESDMSMQRGLREGSYR